MKIADIRIHSWGGLGSQLFAVATAYQVHRKFPKRNIVIFSHSSGVTFRSLELDYRNSWLKFKFKNDYKDNSVELTNLQNNSTFRFRSVIKKLAIALGFMGSLNEDNQIHRLKPWVISIRGHYSHKQIDPETLKFLCEVIDLNSVSVMNSPKIGVHYRLGDLLTLESKSIIAESDLIDLLVEIKNEYSLDQVEVFSDSQLQASSLLSPLKPNLEVISLEALKTIKSLLDHEVFVGTNSKISIWVTLFRLSANPQSIIFLPKKSQEEISRILFDFDTWNNLYFFDCKSK